MRPLRRKVNARTHYKSAAYCTLCNDAVLNAVISYALSTYHPKTTSTGSSNQRGVDGPKLVEAIFAKRSISSAEIFYVLLSVEQKFELLELEYVVK